MFINMKEGFTHPPMPFNIKHFLAGFLPDSTFSSAGSCYCWGWRWWQQWLCFCGFCLAKFVVLLYLFGCFFFCFSYKIYKNLLMFYNAWMMLVVLNNENLHVKMNTFTQNYNRERRKKKIIYAFFCWLVLLCMSKILYNI